MRRTPSLYRRFQRWALTTVNFLRHPREVTCLECGFLAWDEKEVDTPTRIMLANPSSATQPANYEEFHCFRSMWEWPLHYVRSDYAVVQEEVNESRRSCEGFYRYRPGWKPDEHRELVLKAAENRFRVWQTVLSAAMGGLVGFIVARLTD